MSFRTLFITNPSRLSINNKQLIISQNENISIPVEDISTIILDSQQTNITGATLNNLVENNVITYICDNKHIPNGIIIPFNRHSRQLKILKCQLSMNESFKKRIWQQIIIQKIKNQAKILEINKLKNYNLLNRLAQNTNSGDTTNREGVAAKIYFQELFDYSFNRKSDDFRNALLNYGYTILRGAIARTIVSYGYLPSLGLHHKSELNNYNLADDFIEPFRPIIDLWVSNNIDKYNELDTNCKKEIINLLNYNIKIDNRNHSVLNAIDKMVSSFTTAIQENNYKKILLPEIIELSIHKYE